VLRRRFLSAALVGLPAKAERSIQGGFVDNSHVIGHRLRDRAAFPSPKQTTRIPLLIIGAGIAGLSAAWRLDKRGFRDFLLLEMEDRVGGNSRWGENEITPYPWAAHYVPVPDKSARLVREIMEDLGVLKNGTFDERHLCHDPQERLFLHGRWQEGLEPEIAASRRDRDQYHRFKQIMEEFEDSGEFHIPMESGKLRRADLDRISIDDWLRRKNFDSPYLRWMVDYACRDDYGATASQTSAWAGIHYFSARGQIDEKGPLTWPEGNGWIVRQLLKKLSPYVRATQFVHRIEQLPKGFRVLTSQTEYHADAIIFAAPTYLAPYLIEGLPPARVFEYSPWLTANLTLDRMPRERGFPLAWDNVIYDSPALGYVVATHQSLRTRTDRTVWTYYWPTGNRAELLNRDWGYWKEAILNDLARAHPDIRDCVARIDIMRLGHAMIRPAPGFLFSEDRKRWLTPARNLFFANSDLSGLSLFEEAQYRGVQAATQFLQRA